MAGNRNKAISSSKLRLKLNLKMSSAKSKVGVFNQYNLTSYLYSVFDFIFKKNQRVLNQ